MRETGIHAKCCVGCREVPNGLGGSGIRKISETFVRAGGLMVAGPSKGSDRNPKPLTTTSASAITVFVDADVYVLVHVDIFLKSDKEVKHTPENVKLRVPPRQSWGSPNRISLASLGISARFRREATQTGLYIRRSEASRFREPATLRHGHLPREAARRHPADWPRKTQVCRRFTLAGRPSWL
jgi:hypothetical protein